MTSSPRFVRNPLTGRDGMYAPLDTEIPVDRRPLASVGSAVLAGKCVLCHQIESENGKLIVAEPNRAPLSAGHTMFTWRRHIVSPVEATPAEWQELVVGIENFLNTTANGVAYGNMGVHSGASQHHLHAHALTGPSQGELEYFPDPAICPICAKECPELLRRGNWSIQFVPGGRHGEVIAVHDFHANQLPHPEELADLLTVLFGCFANATWDSARMFWHRPGHAHIHIQPCITADGALEVGGQIAVSRYGFDHLSDVLNP